MQNHVVIMAGGIGSRFWPMSVPEYPKQFIDVMGVGKSLIQLTAERFEGKHSVNHVFLSPTSIINFTSKKQSYDDTRRSSRDNELLQRAQSDL